VCAQTSRLQETDSSSRRSRKIFDAPLCEQSRTLRIQNVTSSIRMLVVSPASVRSMSGVPTSAALSSFISASGGLALGTCPLPVCEYSILRPLLQRIEQESGHRSVVFHVRQDERFARTDAASKKHCYSKSTLLLGSFYMGDFLRDGTTDIWMLRDNAGGAQIGRG
jgi:hypothetical protein